jgi:hypothetical protein
MRLAILNQFSVLIYAVCHILPSFVSYQGCVVQYIDGCLGVHDILVYWNESTLYNFRKSNYVQQRKMYTTKAAIVYLYCYNCYITRYARA